MLENFDLIHRYSRADAIRDGVLIDVTTAAREAGIRWPVALTRAAWERCVRVPDDVECQDEADRPWGVLWLLALTARRCQGAEVRGAAPALVPAPPADRRSRPAPGAGAVRGGPGAVAPLGA
jgi:hypothetical protein